MRDLMLGAALLVLAVSTGCTRKTTPEDCEKFADHMTAMTAQQTAAGMGGKLEGAVKDYVQSTRPIFVKQCAGMPKAVYECMMRGTSLKSIQEECKDLYKIK